MKQFNKLYKSIIAMVLLFSCVNAFAQSPIAFGSPYVRNWRAYEQYPAAPAATYYTVPTNLATIGNNIYSFGRRFFIPSNGRDSIEAITTMFNPKTNQWIAKANAPITPFGYNVNFVINDVYYFGMGKNHNSFSGLYTYANNTIHSYNATTNVWDTVASNPLSELANPICFTLNSNGYVVGGSSASNINNTTKYYNPTTNTWNNADAPPVDIDNDNNTIWQCFTANGKAYIFSTVFYINAMYEFNPNATSGNQWTAKTNINLADFRNCVSYNTANGVAFMGGNYTTSVDDGNGNITYTTTDNDSIRYYNVSTDVWTTKKSPHRFVSDIYSTVLNNELFYYNGGGNRNFQFGYDEEYGAAVYVDNSFLSTPLDTVSVQHTFTGLCGSTMPTISYSVDKPLNHDNQFIIALTTNEGYILDTLATVNDSISGSTTITMPSFQTIAQKVGGVSTGQLANLKLAVLTTSPRTIFKNQSTSFALIQDPANLQVSVQGNGQNTCPGTPLTLTAYLDEPNVYGFFKPTTVNWGSVSGGTAPSNDSINVLTSDSMETALYAYPISVTKTFFCYNKDTSFTYNYPHNASISRQNNPPIPLYKLNIAEGNSICNGGNETKHIYTSIPYFYYITKDTFDIAYTYLLNGNPIKTGHYTKYPSVEIRDTLTLNNVNANDELKLKLVYDARVCDAGVLDSSTTTLVFKNYDNSLDSNKFLEYKFNSNLVDGSIKHNNGLGENIAFTTNRFGKPNSALRIFRDSAATNVSQVVSDTTVDITGNAARTISFWFKTDSLGYHYSGSIGGVYQYPHRPAILGWGSVSGSQFANGTGSFIHIAPDIKAVIFRGHYNDVYTNSDVFKFNEWTHVAFVYDSVNFNIYVNGKCEAHSYDAYSAIESNAGYAGWNTHLNTENSHFRIGNDGTGIDFNGDWKAPYDGSVDDIFIYNQAMNACQIDSLYRMTESNCTPTSHTINAAICSGGNYMFNGINRTTTGSYKDTLINANGCDSIVTLNLYVKQKSSSTINRTFCDGGSYNFNGKIKTVAGTYKDTLINAVGCDSIITLNLTKVYPTTSSKVEYKCTSEMPFMWNGNSYTTYGVHTVVLVNANGCDSTAYLDLRRPVPATSNNQVSICSSQLPYTWNGVAYTVAGSHASATLQTANGCDSVATLILTIKQNSSKLIKDTINSGSSYSFNGTNYNTTGIYTATLINSVGCDSVITLQLYVKQAGVPITGNLVGCSFVTTNSLNVSIGGGAWRSSNTAVATINQFGVVTNLSNGTTTITYTRSQSGVTYVSSVVYTVAVVPTLSSISGSNAVCVGKTIQLSNATSGGIWTSLNDRGQIDNNGLYTGGYAGNWGEVKYTVTNNVGCKTSINKVIIVNAIPAVPSIVYAAGTITNPQAGAPTGGFCVGKVFSVTGVPNGGTWSAVGAVSITSNGGVSINAVGAGSIKYVYTNSNGCSNDRTMSGNGYACAARGISIDNNEVSTSNLLAVYPNPVKGNLITVELGEWISKSEPYTITTLEGRKIQEGKIINQKETIYINSLVAGSYIIKVGSRKPLLLLVN